MTPYHIDFKDPSHGIVISCQGFWGSTKQYYLEDIDNPVWRCCKTERLLQGSDVGKLNSFVMIHLLRRIRDYYPSHNFG